MSSFPVLPLFTDAFIADTGHLSAQETGAYLMLMMVAWRSPECRLVDDDDRLARWARVDRRTWLRIKPAVMEFWTLQDGFWTQKRLSKERDGASKRADAARENGKQGGRPKSLQNNDTANPAGSQRVSGSKASISTSKDYSGDKPLRNSAQKRGNPKTPIEDGTQPTERQLADARAEGLSLDEIRFQWRRFRDHHLKEASKFADWPAAWRNWLTNPIRQREAHGSRAGPRAGSSSAQADFLNAAKHYHDDLTGDRDDEGPFDPDTVPDPSGGRYANGHAGPGNGEQAGGRLRLAPPRLAGPTRPH